MTLEFLSLIGITALYIFCACLTYREDWRQAWWYLPVGVGTGAIASIVWYCMAAYLADRQRIYIYNLLWDTLMCGTFYLVPVLFFGVRLDRIGLVGLALMVVGSVILKTRP